MYTSFDLHRASNEAFACNGYLYTVAINELKEHFESPDVIVISFFSDTYQQSNTEIITSTKHCPSPSIHICNEKNFSITENRSRGEQGCHQLCKRNKITQEKTSKWKFESFKWIPLEQPTDTHPKLN